MFLPYVNCTLFFLYICIEKVIASKSARKSKDAGTPENKVQSPLVPNGQSENASNTESPVQAFCKLDREINLLRINPETLKSVSDA